MPILTITSKGQVTLRKDLLRHLGVEPGDKVAVDKLPDGRIAIKAARPRGKISDAFNFLKKKSNRVLSNEEITEVSQQAWAGKR
jgi:AbrB family looped-hinge helix DNA binding protein